MDTTIEVAIVEDNNDIREAIRALINGTYGFTCLHAYSNGFDAIKELPDVMPDVVMMDINMPGMTGIECVKKLKGLMPATQFIMETVYEDDDNIFKALRAGASGYILKKTPAAKILEAITEVHNGGSPMSAEVARRVVSSLQQNSKNSAGDVLTDRETEVLKLLARGFIYKEIASEINVEYETVKKHIQNIYAKLHVQNKVEAINKVFPQ
ncbi:MAG: DNA-binding response regulator [Flavipsychrobacter sp.]|nr:DNA-binding response regulator [Flavipsychrobacter sp.]